MSGAATPAPRARLADYYYLVGTPLFAGADYFLGISVRAAFLDGWPVARYGYYAVCFGCGLLSLRVPRMARTIAITESSANIVLLIFSIMMTYYAAVDRLTADQPVGDLLGPQRAANLALAAVALIVAYFRSQRPAIER